MSNEGYGEASIEAGLNYTPMVDATAPPKKDEPTIDSDFDSLREFTDERSEPETPIIPVEYRQAGGEDKGELVPENQTVKLEDAARHLANWREQHGQAAEAETNRQTADVVDTLRGVQTPTQPQEATTQQPTVEQQQQSDIPEVPGIDPEIVKAISANPALREALQKEVAEVEAARQVYTQGLQQNAAAAYAAVFAAYPEIANISPNELPAALKVIGQQNPKRAQELAGHIQQVNAVVQQWQHEAAQNQQRQLAEYQQRWNEFAKLEDAKFEQAAPDTPEARANLGRAAVKTMREVGFTDDDLQQAWWGRASISLRDHRAQLIIRKAAMYDEAMRAVPQKINRPIPPVQKPGVARDGADRNEADLRALQGRLNATGDIKDAVKLLEARRAARG